MPKHDSRSLRRRSVGHLFRRQLAIEGLESRILLATNIGAVRPGGSNLLSQFLDTESLSGTRNSNAEIVFDFGHSTTTPGGNGQNDVALAGDLSGIGFDQAITVRYLGGSGPTMQWLGDTDRDTTHEYLFRFGTTNDVALVGNFNGLGPDDVAAVRSSGGGLDWYLSYASAAPARFPTDDSALNVSAQFKFGLAGDVPKVGDFNNDGRADIAVVRDVNGFLTWYVHFAAAGATPYPFDLGQTLSVDASYTFGLASDKPVVGNWDNSGGDNLGVVREGAGAGGSSQWLLDTNFDPNADIQLDYGLTGDQYIIGRWVDKLFDGGPSGTGTDWATAENWSNDTLPISSHHVMVDQPAITLTLNANTNAIVQSLNTTERVNFSSGTFTVANSVSFPQGIDISGGTLAAAGIITLPTVSVSTWTAGQVGLAGYGTIMQNYGTLTFSGASSRNLQNATFHNPGVFHQTDGQLVINSSTFNNGGTYNLQGASSNPAITTTSGAFNNSGVFNDTMTGTHGVSGSFSNSGSLSVAAGTFQLPGGNSHTGVFSVANGATLEIGSGTSVVGGAISGAGSVVKSGTGTLTISGANTYTGETRVAAGTLRLGVNNAIPSASKVVLGSSVATGTLDLRGFNQTLSEIAISQDASLPSQAVVGNSSVTSNSSLSLNGDPFVANGFSGLIVDSLGGGTRTTSLAINSGLWSLDGMSTFSGGTTIASGSLVQMSSNRALGGGSITVASGGLLRIRDDITVANAITLQGATGSGALVSHAGVNTILGTLTLNGSSGVVINPASSLTISGSLVLGGNDLTVTSNGDSAISGVVSGTGNLAKAGTGTLTVSGASTYTGETRVQAGTLKLGANNPLHINSKIVLGTTTTSGTLDLSGFNLTTSDVAVAAGATASSQVIGNSSTSSNSTLSLNGYTLHTFDGTMVDTLGSGNRNVGLAINGGSWSLGGASTFSGGTTIASGSAASMFNSAALGSGSITVAGGGFLGLNSTITVANPITLQGASGTGAISNTTGTNTLTGTLTLTGSSGILTNPATTLNLNGPVTLGSNTLTVTSNGTADIGGVISGSGALTMAGAGSMTLAAANTFAGTTTINSGTLQLGVAGALPPTAFVDTGVGSTFSLNNFNQRATVQGPGNIDLGSGTLTVAFFGNVVHSGSISGSGGIVKDNGGTWTLNGTHTYTGTTTVNGGILALNGSSVSSFDVASGAMLVGAGTTSGSVNVQAGGSIAPGNSPGILNSGNFSLQAGSTLEIEIGGTTPGNTADNHDQINVTGTVTLAGNLSVASFNGFDPQFNNTVVIINNDGTDAINGTFAGLPEGSLVSFENVTYRVSYVGGTGNDVTLTVLGHVFEVINTLDSGTGSLREAITRANSTAGLDRIIFNIPGNGVHTITPLSALPTIIDTVTIDGTTESDFAGAPLIELRGDLAGAGVNALTLTASNGLVRGLVVNSFGGNGIVIRGATASGNRIEGNYIGTSSSGNAAAPNAYSGIVVQDGASNNTIGGNSVGTRNVISGNLNDGILVRGNGTSGIVVAGNYVGTNAAGSAAIANSHSGIRVSVGATNTRIGTNGDGVLDADERNVISGNFMDGISIHGIGTIGTVVAGNFIGTNALATVAIANSLQGIAVFDQASQTVIGTDGSNDAFNSNERNVISGNLDHGVTVAESGTNSTVVAGNYIGTDVSGSAELGNRNSGVRVNSGALGTRIGTNGDGVRDVEERNVISGNLFDGISIHGANTNNTLVAGNYVGLSATGDLALANTLAGIAIFDGAAQTIIGTNGSADAFNINEQNIVSGNGTYGILVADAATTDTKIAGNWVGINASGTATPNMFDGVLVTLASATRIGTDGNGIADADERNVISGNNWAGVAVVGGANSSVIAGNYIGTNPAGSAAVGNGGAGIYVGPSTGTIIGTNGDDQGDANEGNLISGNGGDGIRLTDLGTSNAVIAGNQIGTDLSGMAAIPNALAGIGIHDGVTGTRIGTDGDGISDGLERNIISGNAREGIWIRGLGADDSVIAGNYVGLAIDGQSPLANGLVGINIGAARTRIGTNGDGTADNLERNIVSGNGQFGILVDGLNANDTQIAGNFVGTNATGTSALGNGWTGIFVAGGAKRTRIGTNGDGVADTAERNLVSGGSTEGIKIVNAGTDQTVVAGNFIGTDVTGMLALPNAWLGIAIAEGATNTRIGTDASNDAFNVNERNVVSGNNGVGVYVADATTSDTVIAGNYIGVNTGGNAVLSNLSYGVQIRDAQSTRIGTNGDGQQDVAERNVVSGNLDNGIDVRGAATNGTVIAGNYIGTDATGTLDFGNQWQGIAVLDGPTNTRIGTDGSNDAFNGNERNVISGNNGYGIFLAGATTSNITIAGNYVGTTADGLAALGNSQHGIGVGGNVGVRIGTDGNGVADAEERNVVSGSGWHGIAFYVGATDGIVAGNYVGTNAFGTGSLGNSQDGVWIGQNSKRIRVGAVADGINELAERNVISANGLSGVAVVGNATDQVTLAQNYIGTDVTGNVDLGNGRDGIYLESATNTLLRANTVSGNNRLGIYVRGSLFTGSVGGTGTVVIGNFVGTNAAGTAVLANSSSGIQVDSSSIGTRIGSDGDGINDAAERNIISGNGYFGVAVGVRGTDDTVIRGNYIGTDVTGTLDFGNTNAGVALIEWYYSVSEGSPKRAVVDGNLISGNNGAGVLISGPGSDNHRITGNQIGTNAAGTTALANSQSGIQVSGGAKNTLIGTDGDGLDDIAERNVVSGNSQYGVSISGVGTDNTVVAGNYIGVSASGAARIANTWYGVAVSGSALNTRIGTNGDGNGYDANERNIIAGNSLANIFVSSSTTVIAGNYIGANATGSASIGNGSYGIYVFTGASDVRIGTDGNGVADADERNLISGNGSYGIYAVTTTTSFNSGIRISGNSLGINAAGNAAIGNTSGGIYVSGFAGTLIGTDGSNDAFNANERNTISGNSGPGITLADSSTSGTVIAGNWIGVNSGGTGMLANSQGGVTITRAVATRIGTNADGVADTIERNVISGNTGSGVTIQSGLNEIYSNARLDAMISGSLPATIVSGSIPQSDMVESNSPRPGLYSFNHTVPGGGGDDYGFIATGTLQVNVTGFYSFAYSGDQGGRLKINGATVINENSLVSYTARYASVQLSAGVHTFEWSGFDRTGNSGFELMVNVGANITSTPNATNGWKVLGDASPHLAIALSGTIAVTAYYSSQVVVTEATVAGNYIGINLAGTSAIANSGNGILIAGGASNNRIGTNGDGAGDATEANVISGNTLTGVTITGTGTNSNWIAGNIIGLGSDGTTIIANAGNAGVLVSSGAQNTTIGTNGDGVADAAERNTISGNSQEGLQVESSTTTGTLIAGNYIGTDVTGTLGRGNSFAGIIVWSGAANTRVSNNLVSANLSYGVHINGATSTTLTNNLIGTQVSGSGNLGNILHGVYVTGNASGNTIGGSSAADRNVIAYNNVNGIEFRSTGAAGNSVLGNYIGTDVSGTTDAGNVNFGILVRNSPNVTIGGTVDGARNIISGNDAGGVAFIGGTTTANTTSGSVQGNFIGLDRTGLAALRNNGFGVFVGDGDLIEQTGTLDASGIVIGGSTISARNVISGNTGSGIWIGGTAASSNSIYGNFIGTNANGSGQVANAHNGIFITDGATNTQVGGPLAGQRNVISGNIQHGVSVVQAGTGTKIQGNFIGTDVAGTNAVGNASSAITSAAGVFVSDMGGNSVIIGVDGNGLNDAGEWNLISGNRRHGIRIEGGNSELGSHVVAGNLIGVNVGITASLPNQGDGIIIVTSSNNRIGTDGDGFSDELEGNVIAGNRNLGGNPAGASQVAAGILVTDSVIGDGRRSHNNTIAGNFIGTGRVGILTLGNQGPGIAIDRSTATVIGGSTSATQNLIYYGSDDGIDIRGTGELGITAEQSTSVLLNSFRANAGLAIDVGSPGISLNDDGDTDGTLNFPIITSASVGSGNLTLEGFVGAGRTIELYIATPEAGMVFGEGLTRVATFVEGSLTDLDTSTGSYGPTVAGVTVATGSVTSPRYRFTISLPAGVANGTLLTARALGSSSEFSPFIVTGEQASAIAPVITLAQSTITLQAGGELNVAGSFVDPDSSSWTATVNYGDGTGVKPLPLYPDRTFTLTHVYANAGVYTVTVTITDNSLATGTNALLVTVNDVAPAATFNVFTVESPVNEGAVTTLTGSFSDPNPANTHTVDIVWGDGTTSQLSLPAGVLTFSTTHIYRDDSNATNAPSAQDVYNVQVTVNGPGGSDSTPLGLFLVEVRNVAPHTLSVVPQPTLIVEGGTLYLFGDNAGGPVTFVDPGVLDTHTARVDWGDGTIEFFQIPASGIGGPTLKSLPALSHVYRDDPATGPDEYTVTIEITDDDEPLNPVRYTRVFPVTNAIPSNVVVNVIPTAIDEGGTVTLSGSFIDPGVDDTHRVFINWGDGTSETVVDLPAGATSKSFSGIAHQYLNDPANAVSLSNQYTITVRVADNDNPLSFGTGSTLVSVNNVAPVLGGLTFAKATPMGPLPIVPGIDSINEGDTITISGSFTDLGQADRHEVSVNWGSGITAFANVVEDATNQRFTFTATYQYRNNFNPANIVVTVKDGRWVGSTFEEDGGVASSTAAPLRVRNVAPTASIAPLAGSTPTNTLLKAVVTDPGLDDSFSYAWTVNGTSAGGGSTLTLNATTFTSPPVIRVTVTDNDNESSSFVVLAIFGTDAAETIAVTSVTTNGIRVTRDGQLTHSIDLVGAGTLPSNILIMGFGGQDILDARALPATHKAILDGGQATDFLIGGAGEDEFYAHEGDDTADGGTGGDTFLLTPNSNLTVIDTSGDNTLDFTRADFKVDGVSSGTGITFDLSLIPTSGTTTYSQAVSTVGGTHIVSALGNFPNLVGSNFGDTLTASSGSKISGGGGADRIIVKGNTTNVTLSGGADDDIFEVTGTSILNLNFSGDAGIDTFINSGSITGLTFSGGADGDIFTNQANATIANLNFSGDAGIDQFTNLGTITNLTFGGGADADIFTNEQDASITGLTFSGGADDDLFTNYGAVVGTLANPLNFKGDEGIDRFINFGSVTGLTFTGGADNDLFINDAAGVITGLNFGGDDGLDALTNLGTITNLTFSGGADDDLLTNAAGATLNNLNFGGDAGVDLLTNNGTINGLIFNGGADSDVFLNNSVLNGTITFGGGADDDLFTNAIGATVGNLNFNGDAGLDTLNNLGTITQLNFQGGADDDILINSTGALVSSLTFGGVGADAGADVLSNLGQIGTVVFTGGADADLFENRGSVGSVTFHGGADNDIFNNTGSITGVLGVVFNGGADDDFFLNSGSVTKIIFSGGADNDVFVNSGPVGEINFSGDEGIDAFKNSGTVTTLVFTGGADAGGSSLRDDDVFYNSGTVAHLTFHGGADNDFFENSGQVTTLIFNGGADNDLFNNLGTVASLTFGGDAGADFLQNSGAVINLTFHGDAGVDTLNNLGAVTNLTFNGGADKDIFVNSGAVLNLTFSGGADADVLQNNGPVKSINFGGDSGDDILINYGTFESLLFSGGADDDILANYAELVGNLVFHGDFAPGDPLYSTTTGGNDTLIVRGAGNSLPTTKLTFHGGGGKNAFQNNATGFAAVTFIGGADDDVFQNNADGIANITFGGDAGADIFENNGNGVLNIDFNGDLGADLFINDGANVSGILFTGGAADDLFINNGANVTNVIFHGGADKDIFVNNGIDVSNLTFNGGADDDIFVNSGANLRMLVFNGDAGNDQLWNRTGGVGASQLTFHGDAGNDLFINDAASVSQLTFNGGADDDAFQNNGVKVAALVFNGGADDDLLINTGNDVNSIVFNGDHEADGSSSSTADHGADIFVNRGNKILSITMTGGGDNDQLINQGIGIGTITFTGGADSDSLINNGQVTEINFQGDAGEDILQNNSSVDGLVFDGGADNDLLQNNGPAVALTFYGGADDDVFVNNGSDVQSIIFHGETGVDTLINNGINVANIDFYGGADGDYLRLHGTGIGDVLFDGGDGTDSFDYNAISTATASITFDAGGGNDSLTWQGYSANGIFHGGAGNDRVVVVGSGVLRLNGDVGDDEYTFVGNPVLDVTLGETYVGASDPSQDTLNFSAFTGGPLSLDLRSTARQPQPATSTQFFITLVDGMGMENVVGTQFGDTIDGNARDNVIFGAEYVYHIDPSAPVARPRNQTQWVLLDFDTKTEPGEHVYTLEERTSIVDRVNAVYRGPSSGTPWFDVRVTQNLGDIPTGILYATIYFNDTPGFGRPGGLASEIDLGNQNLGGTAQVQVNGLLGGTVTAEEASAEVDENLLPGFHGHAPIFGDASVGSLKPDATSENFIKLSAKIAAHELGHLLGLRHQDSFGPIGLGLHDPPGSGAYNPVFTGPSGGFESFDHMSGSPASIGSSRFTDLNDLFFGERETVKLAFAGSHQQDVYTLEQTGLHNTIDIAQPLPLINLSVPNTLSRGMNRDKNFFVQAQSLEGTIGLVGGKSESDFFRFSGRAGDIVNIDILSNSLVGRPGFGSAADDYVDSILRVYYIVDGTATLVPYYGGLAENDDQFEPTDSSLIDLVLPATGDYFIEVDTFKRTPGTASYNAAVAARDAYRARLNDLNAAELDALKRIEDTINDTDIGKYQLIIYSFSKASKVDGIDSIKGHGGKDTIDGGVGDSYVMAFAAGANVVQNEGDTLVRNQLQVTDRAASSWTTASLITSSIVNYGDGSGDQILPVDAQGRFSLNHTYRDNGKYTVTVTIRNDIGQTLTNSFEVTVANVAPKISVTGAAAVAEGSVYSLTLGAVTDPGTDTVTSFIVHWGDGSSNTYSSSGAKTHTYADNGAYNITVDLVDEDGTFSNAGNAHAVTVTNVGPTIAVTGAAAVAEGSVYSITLGAVADPGTDTVTSFIVHWGDGSSNTYSSSGAKTHTYADDGAYNITVDLIDEDGTFSNAGNAHVVTVVNVAPTIAVTGAAAVAEGSVYSITLGAVADPGTDTVTSFIVHWGDGSSNTYNSSGAKTHTYADDGAYNITVDLIDEDGTFSDASNAHAVTVTNVAPTIVIDGTRIVGTGSSYSLTLGTVTDPGNDTVTHYIVHWGDSTSSTYTSNGVVTHNYTSTATSFAITVDLVDEDGTHLHRANLHEVINNRAPTVAIATPTDGVMHVDSTFVFSATDPDVSDQNGNYRYFIDWGDGSSVQEVSGGTTTQVSRAYSRVSAQGVFTITVTAVDPRGLTSTNTARADFGVLGWSLMTDPTNASRAILVVVGSQGPDDIKVKDKNGDKFKIKIKDKEDEVKYKGTVYGDVKRVLIFGLGGDDTITFDDNIEVGASIWGGDGNDKIKGGEGDDIILGGAGDDTLFGGKGQDILIGGTGADKIHGDQDDDILIAGYTLYDSDFNRLHETDSRRMSFDAQRIALEAILAEWNSQRTYDQRRNNIQGVSNAMTSDRLNANYYFKSNGNLADVTVFDDNAKDSLWGDAGVDWYFAHLGGGGVLDEIKDLKNNESASEDKWWL